MTTSRAVGVLIFLASLSYGGPPAAALPCHDLARDALVAGILDQEGGGFFGQPGDVTAVRRCLDPIDRRPPGSENWPVVGRVGIVLQGPGPWSAGEVERAERELLPFLRGQNDWGLGGGEGKSEIYGAWNPAAMLAWWNLRLREAAPNATRSAVRR